MIDFGVLFTTAALIFPSELPDKTFIATLVLATRFPRRAVWLGVVAAFAVQVTIAVLAGGLLSLAPERLVYGITFVLFTIGAVLLIRQGLTSRANARAEASAEIAETESDEKITHMPLRPGFVMVFTTSFAIIFTAEWGDLSQLFTAGLAARTGDPLSVGIGAWIALAAVAALATFIGGYVQERIPLYRIRLISGGILAALAVWTAIEFLQS
ncbi:MAG TPA: TMEM165/GDT1 family protein [Candidatus Nanopelagicales bacterium]|nr:TMEM165/GDT1 family protein [Candidatus Nanopelagicales bacterium]